MPGMKTLYARYNRHRLPLFQIETSIVEMNGSRSVVKRALSEEAKSHICAMRTGYGLIRRSLKSDKLILPRLENSDASSIMFQYVEGQSLDQLLFQSFRAGDKPSFFKIIADYCSLLQNSFGFDAQPEISPRITEVFGMADAGRMNGRGGWLPLAAVDATFENIIVSGKSCYLIDNEWVFEGVLPFAFLLFRSLFYFHKVKYHELGIEKWITFGELLEKHQIRQEDYNKYLAMDEMFQSYVYGPERCYKYKEQYKKRQISVHSLEKTIGHQREVMRKYHGEIMHMRAILADRERIIDEIVNSLGWRLWQKTAGVLNQVCPPGSRRRRAADRLIAPLKARRSERRINI